MKSIIPSTITLAGTVAGRIGKEMIVETDTIQIILSYVLANKKPERGEKTQRPIPLGRGTKGLCFFRRRIVTWSWWGRRQRNDVEYVSAMTAVMAAVLLSPSSQIWASPTRMLLMQLRSVSRCLSSGSSSNNDHNDNDKRYKY